MSPLPRPRWYTGSGVRVALLLVLAGAIVLTVRFIRNGGGSAQVFVTKVGEMRTIALPDSSQATLAPLTELKVAGNYGRENRGVDLNGEAWFEVKQDSARPFHVRTLGTITESPGASSFAVRAFKGDSVVNAVVGEGSATVRLANSPTSPGAVLNAHDAVQLDTRTFAAHILRGVAVESLTGWRSGHLDFSNAVLGDVAVALQRWYGITTRFEKPELAGSQVSYSIPTNDWTKALEVMSRSIVVHLERKGDTLFVR
jgi:transmembrane sensor